MPVYKLAGKLALPMFKMMNGAISDTQRAALETGTVGWEASLFKGKPDWEALKNMPPPVLTAEEQSFLDNETEELCRLIDDWKIRDELKDLPPEVWDFLKQNKFFGMIIPKRFGGLEFSAYAHSQIVGRIASRSGTVGATTMVPNSLGPAELLLRYGTKTQQDHYLPRLADGREIPCFALTSPQAGSDATNLKDEGVVFQGDDGKTYIRLNWDKRYTTLGPVATVLGIAFQMKDPDNLLGKGENPGITLALVPSDKDGINVGMRHRPLGSPFQNGPHWGTDVVIGTDDIIGGPDYAGKGWDMLVDCLSIGRSISLPASSNGAAQFTARVTGAYASVRQQFNLPIAKMEGVQEALARIGGMTYMIDAVRTMPLQDLDLAHEAGKEARPAVASAILKYHTTEMGRQVIIDAMDIHGGKGVCEGPNNPVSGNYQGVTVGITVEGANIMTRNLMIFGQGAFLAHPYVLDEMRAAKNSDVREAGKLGLKHLFNMLGNAVFSFGMGITNGAGSGGMYRDGADAAYYARINRMSSAFSYAADLTMIILQSKLMRLERTSALLGDTFSHLYMASNALRRFHLDGRPKEDAPLMKWAVERSLYKAEEALYELIDNHPSAFAKWMLKPLIFPMGRRNRPPSHKLDAQVADAITTPGPVRDRLTRLIYKPKAEHEYMARLERAFDLCQKAGPHETALFRAAKKGQLSQTENYERMIDEAREKELITPDIHALLQDAMKARADIVQVDYFPQEWNGKPMQGKPAPKPAA